METDIEDIEIKIKLSDDGQTKAIAVLDFGDFNFKGFRVKDCKHGLFVDPPAYRGKDSKYHTLFWMEKRLWKILERKILNEYRDRDIKIGEKEMKQ